MTGSGVSLKEKLLATFVWSSLCIAAAMLLDYFATVYVLPIGSNYRPVVTFLIATIVAAPTTFAFVSAQANLRRARDELASARDAAVNSSLSKTIFFANMSHELRTPLNAILGFSELLQSEVFAERRLEYARLIHGSGSHLLDLVNDLLDISRMEAGKLQLTDEPLRIPELLDECIAIVGPRARKSRLRIQRKFAGDLPIVVADRRAIKQVALNLLTNAVKFSDVGGTVEVFAFSTNEHAFVFGVKDYGIGIAEEDHAKVFEAFRQSRHDALNAQEGTGLGLPIVKGLAEAHSGTVLLESRLGEGTRVSVRLPPERVLLRPAFAAAS